MEQAACVTQLSLSLLSFRSNISTDQLRDAGQLVNLTHSPTVTRCTRSQGVPLSLTLACKSDRSVSQSESVQQIWLHADSSLPGVFVCQ